jgi:Mg-chelatase subunit ChlD
MKKIFVQLALLFACLGLYAQDLTITADDVRIELLSDGGFHLYIRKKPEISSVLLTESTKDPSMQMNNYAYRSAERNPVNGDEIRIIDGVPIPKTSSIYSLISSTVIDSPYFGKAFHIYIPYMLYFGYPPGRYGEVYVQDGMYLNIRAFALPYADYRGVFKDNPFLLEARQEQEAPKGKYLQETADNFKEIAKTGNSVYANDPDDLIDKIKILLALENGKNIDIVFCVDTTGSMKKYIDSVREKLVPMMQDMIKNYPSFRIGMVLFRDYYEEYLTKVIPFTSDFAIFKKNLDAIRVRGGGDVPEAVYEALYAGASDFVWSAEAKVMILIGDAPPHPKPRGKITKDMLDKTVAEKGLKVNSIILPQ